MRIHKGYKTLFALQSVEFDFCLDDCVCLARVLRGLGVTVTLDILEGLPHGFFNLCYLSPETRAGVGQSVKRVRGLLYPDEEGQGSAKP